MPATENRTTVAQLVDDYSGWLQFVVASHCTFRHYEHHVTHLARLHPDLDGYCEYLRNVCIGEVSFSVRNNSS